MGWRGNPEPVTTQPHAAPWAPLVKRERDRRRLERGWAREAGLPLPRLRTVMLVEPEAIHVPQWALEKAVPGLTATREAVWLGRIAAKLLIELDESAGGTPKVTVSCYRRCGLCGRVLLGVEAEQRYSDELHFGGQHTICGPTCVERQRARREKPKASDEVAELSRRSRRRAA